jgi:two-component system NtrC family sensor kinase
MMRRTVDTTAAAAGHAADGEQRARVGRVHGIATYVRGVLLDNAIVIASIVAVLSMLACVSLRVWSERGHTIDAGNRTAEIVVQLLEEQTVRALQSVDLTLTGVVDAMRVVGPVRNYDPDIEQMLRERVASLPYVRAMFVVSTSGHVIQHSGSPQTRGVNVSDRDYFQAHVIDPDLGMYFGGPFLGRVSRAPSIGMTRRISGPDGSFGGVVTAAVDPRYFEQFYRSLRLSPADSVALFHADGTLLSTEPLWHEDRDPSAPASDLFKAAIAAAQSEMPLEGTIDRRRYLVSARRLDTAPVLVAIALSEDEFLSSWRQNTIIAYAESGVFGLAIIGLAILLTWHRRRFELARERQMQAHNLESLGRMTGGIAHDFRNTLSIIGTSLAAARSSRDPARAKRWISIGEDAAEEGNQLITRLLAFSRSQELSIQATGVNEEIKAVTPLLQEAAGPLISIARDFGGDVRPCLMDRSQFASALINLVMNARDAIVHRGTVRIATSNLADDERASFHVAEGAYVRVTVSDDGRGMPASVARRAVEPFFTTKGQNGTGLGLSQVYGFVRQLGGDMKIESAVDSGTSVHLILPVARAGESTAAHPESEDKAVKSGEDLQAACGRMQVIS